MKPRNLISARFCLFSDPVNVNSYDLAVDKADWDLLFTHVEEDFITIALFRDSAGKSNPSSWFGHAPFFSGPVAISIGMEGNDVRLADQTKCRENDDAKSLGLVGSIQSLNCHYSSEVQFTILRKLNDVCKNVQESSSATTPRPSTGSGMSGNHSKSKAKISKSTSELDERLKIYCTDQFLRHYIFAQNSSFQFRPVVTVPLSKLTLGANSHAAYRWAEENTFCASLVVSVSKEKIMCRKGDLFVLPYTDLIEDATKKLLSDFLILDCEPVMQGHMTVNTALIITNLKKTMDMDRLSKTKHIGKDIVTPPSAITKSLLFSDFLGSLRKPMVFTNKSECSVADEESVVTLTPIVDNLMLQSSFRKNDCISFDLVLIPKSLLVRMGLFHDSLVFLSVTTPSVDISKSNVNRRSRVARVNHGPDDCDDENIYLSPSMLFNLLDIPSILDSGQNPIKVNVQVRITINFFTSVALGTWSKNYWADHEKVCFFLNLIFWAVRNLKFRHELSMGTN
jgi:hypothetical protein